jgi:hypothetical protein
MHSFDGESLSFARDGHVLRRVMTARSGLERQGRRAHSDLALRSPTRHGMARDLPPAVGTEAELRMVTFAALALSDWLLARSLGAVSYEDLGTGLKLGAQLEGLVGKCNALALETIIHPTELARSL